MPKTHITRVLAAGLLSTGILWFTPVSAQPPVKVTDANPKANFVLAVDVSMTQGYYDGTAGARYLNVQRLAQNGEALDLFKYDFNYSFFAYTAARRFVNPSATDNHNRIAQIVDDVGTLLPLRPGTDANPNTITRWASVRDRVLATNIYQSCSAASGKGWNAWNCLEQTTRGGVTGTFPLTPDGHNPANRLIEKAALEKVLDYYSNPAFTAGSGMYLPALQDDGMGNTYTSTPCDTAHPTNAPPVGFVYNPLDPLSATFDCPVTCPVAPCPTVKCFPYWHRAYQDQLTMTGVALDRFDFYFELWHELGYWEWPRYLGNPDAADVQADFCNKLDAPLANIKSRLNLCLPAGAKSDRYWDGSAFTCNQNTLASTICNASGPGGGSPFFVENTCVCFPNQAGCGFGGAAPDDCSSTPAVLGAMVASPVAAGENPTPPVAAFPGSMLALPYRQAEAMCYSERPAVGQDYESTSRNRRGWGPAPEHANYEPRFRTNFRDQPGNVLTAGEKCRANVIGFFTDGVGGDGIGVTRHAEINRWVYKSRNRDGSYFPENHVFHTTARGAGYDLANTFIADAMSNTISGGRRTTAHNATDSRYAAAALAGILNRTQAGQYSPAPMVTDRFGTRLGVISFEIPGRYDTGIAYAPANDHSRYLGRPSRLSWYALDDAGNPTLRWETDWKTKTDAWPAGALSAAYSARFFYGAGSGTNVTLNGTDGRTLSVSMGAQWSATHTNTGNGWTRFRNIPANTLDRDGDGTVDAHPAVAWGGMIGVSNAKPVVVEAPIDPPGLGSTDFQGFVTAAGVGDRPRVVYVQANEFIHAIHAGDRVNGLTNLGTQLGGLSQQRTYDYDDTVAQAGTELWRYRPGFLRFTPRVDLASAMHYSLMNGSMVSRDIKLQPASAVPTTKYATVLAMTQGPTGRGLAVLNISRPHQNLGSQADFVTTAATRKVIFDNVLNAADVASTTADPQIVEWPGTGANANRVGLVLTSGWSATPAAAPKKILMYQLTNIGATNLQAGSTNAFTAYDLSGNLAANATLASGARCVNFGANFACYALDTTGVLWRVRVNLSTGQFIGGSAVNMNALALGGGTVNTARVYNSLPAFYFGTDNALNIVFGSGNPDTLRHADAGDAVYRIRDASLSGGTGAFLTSEVCKEAAGSTSGVIPLPAGERLLTNPVVASGVVSWTTYIPPSGECDVGRTRVYAMDFQTCADATDPVSNLRPVGQDVADGVPTSPTVLPRTGRVLAHSSKQITAAQISGTARTVETRGFLRKPIQRVYRLWWRKRAL